MCVCPPIVYRKEPSKYMNNLSHNIENKYKSDQNVIYFFCGSFRLREIMDQLDTGKGLSAADMKQELGIAVAMLDKASVAATPLRDYRYESKCFVLRCDNKNKTIFMLAYEIRFSRGSGERQAAFLPRLLDPGFPGVFSKPSSLSITLLTKRSAQEGRVVLEVVFAGFCRF